MERIHSATTPTSETNKSCASQRDVEYNSLQELEAPAIVCFAWNESLLYNSQHRDMLVCLDHRGRVSRKERTQQRHKSGDRAFLCPDCRCEKKRKKGAVFNRYPSMQFQHLCKDLEDVGYILQSLDLGSCVKY